MLLSHGSGKQQIDDNKKCRQIAGDFDGHGDAAVRREAHRPMEHIQASLKATGRRHRVSACVISPRQLPWSTISKQLLARNYTTFQALVIRENFIPQNGPSTQIIDATSFVVSHQAIPHPHPRHSKGARPSPSKGGHSRGTLTRILASAC